MKTLCLWLIDCYRIFFSFTIRMLLGTTANSCRYDISCSLYTKAMIQENGVIKGMLLSTKRLLQCQPFVSL